MNIILNNSQSIDNLSEYLDFNAIPYTRLELFDPALDTFGRINLDRPELGTDQLLVLEFDAFTNLLDWPQGRQQLTVYCQQNNHVWIWSRRDGLGVAMSYSKQMQEFADSIPAQSITLFLDGLPGQLCADRLKGYEILIFPYSIFFQMPRIQGSKLDKFETARDFMLITRLKDVRPERKLLADALADHPDICARGHVHFTRLNHGDWVGRKDPTCHTSFAHPSMDIYRDAWFEVVPESYVEGGLLITEKVIKPMATLTPFLLLGAPYHLEYLRKHGFKTFAHVVKEDYDQIINTEYRCKRIVAVLQDIVNNGADSFYHACRKNLEYNYNLLCQISGRYQHITDSWICEKLEGRGIR